MGIYGTYNYALKLTTLFTIFQKPGEEWDRMQGVNARGAFFMTREIARAMVAGGGGGRIVNIISAALNLKCFII